MIVEFITCGIVGFIIGFILGCIIYVLRSATGSFIINTSDPESDYMSLSIDNGDNLYKKKYVLLKIIKK